LTFVIGAQAHLNAESSLIANGNAVKQLYFTGSNTSYAKAFASFVNQARSGLNGVSYLTAKANAVKLASVKSQAVSTIKANANIVLSASFIGSAESSLTANAFVYTGLLGQFRGSGFFFNIKSFGS